jgi:hypothetical protein
MSADMDTHRVTNTGDSRGNDFAALRAPPLRGDGGVHVSTIRVVYHIEDREHGKSGHDINLREADACKLFHCTRPVKTPFDFFQGINGSHGPIETQQKTVSIEKV